jgi:hypothetical protein
MLLKAYQDFVSFEKSTTAKSVTLSTWCAQKYFEMKEVGMTASILLGERDKIRIRSSRGSYGMSISPRLLAHLEATRGT